MRLLHTADWHLGRSIRGRSRAQEFEAVLDEVCGIAEQEGVDVFLVAGDIWDSMSPPPDAERLLYTALRRLVEAGIDVVLIGGNHDNARRLDALGRIGELIGVRTQGFVRRWDQGGTLHVERSGERMNLAALPWIPEGKALGGDEIAEAREAMFQGYQAYVTAHYHHAAQGFEDGAINVFASHVFIDGARVKTVDGSERMIHIGQTFAVPPAALPSLAQYVALGHIHEPQEIDGAPNHAAAYAGSLLQLDFGESRQTKIVRIVDLEPGRPARPRVVRLSSGRGLAEIRGTFDEILVQGESAGDAYLRAVIRVERPESGLAQRLREALPNCVEVRLDITGGAVAREEVRLEGLDHIQQFRLYYARQHAGATPTEEMIALLRALLAEAQEVEA